MQRKKRFNYLINKRLAILTLNSKKRERQNINKLDNTKYSCLIYCMKGFIITLITALGASILISSCATLKHIPRELKFYVIDFTAFTEEGFLFTPEAYLGDYESVGILYLEIYPEYNRIPTTEHTAEGFTSMIWVHKPIDLSAVINSYYIEVTKMGADAVMNFETTAISYIYPGTIMKVEGVKITGYAIKRKN